MGPSHAAQYILGALQAMTRSKGPVNGASDTFPGVVSPKVPKFCGMDNSQELGGLIQLGEVRRNRSQTRPTTNRLHRPLWPCSSMEPSGFATCGAGTVDRGGVLCAIKAREAGKKKEGGRFFAACTVAPRVPGVRSGGGSAARVVEPVTACRDSL